MLTSCSPTNSNKVYANKSFFEVLMINNSVFNSLSSHGLGTYGHKLKYCNETTNLLFLSTDLTAIKNVILYKRMSISSYNNT